LVITPEALDEIVRQGHSLAYGARFLKRVIDERVKIPLSRIWSQAARFRVIAVQNEIVVEATDSESAAIPETLAS
jgi:ATP-dependent Clp protease ATP-binding subunit ClpA